MCDETWGYKQKSRATSVARDLNLWARSRLVVQRARGSGLADGLVHAMRGRVQRVGRAVRRVGRQAAREIGVVSANVAEVVRRPGSLFEVPRLHSRVDLGLVL